MWTFCLSFFSVCNFRDIPLPQLLSQYTPEFEDDAAGTVWDVRDHPEVRPVEPWELIRPNPNGNNIEQFFDRVRFPLPTLIYCKMFKSSLNYKDRAFFAAFVYQNPMFFDEDGEIVFRAIRSVNPNWDETRDYEMRQVLRWLRSAEEGDEKLCRYYAYDINEGRVLDLAKHSRHIEEGSVFGAGVHHLYRNDPCVEFFHDYNRCDLCDNYGRNLDDDGRLFADILSRDEEEELFAFVEDGLHNSIG